MLKSSEFTSLYAVTRYGLWLIYQVGVSPKVAGFNKHVLSSKVDFSERMDIW